MRHEIVKNSFPWGSNDTDFLGERPTCPLVARTWSGMRNKNKKSDQSPGIGAGTRRIILDSSLLDNMGHGFIIFLFGYLPIKDTVIYSPGSPLNRTFAFRAVVAGFAAGLMLACGGTGASSDGIPGGPGTGTGGPQPANTGAFSAPLPIPPLLPSASTASDSREFILQVQTGSTAFFPGKPTLTLGYNGALLGPTIRARRGEDVAIQISNGLPEATTVHWHGLEVPSTMDGGPLADIIPGGSFLAKFKMIQPAATLWYHPHMHQRTGYQVYMGLAGFLLVEDDATDALGLPNHYGVDDIPLAVQDRRFNSDGSLAYLASTSDANGMLGDRILVNGAITPYLELPAGLVRLRLLNGSNARSFTFHWEDGRAFQQIASDGGLLPAPVAMNRLPLAPGERAEILVDFSREVSSKTLELRSDGMTGMGMGGSAGSTIPVMQIRVKGSPTTTAVPTSLAPVPRTPESMATRTRSFFLSDTGAFAINGKTYDPARVDEHVRNGATEIWEVVGSSGMMGMGHPFHVHGVRFQVLSRSGGAVAPAEQGWKDTVLVSPGERVRLIISFGQIGVFPYHCHILEHEDRGMMGLFEVQ